MDETHPPQRLPSGPRAPVSSPPPSGGGSDAVTPPLPSLGSHRIEVKLGQGGMGKVYRCRDELLHRSVAVKVLHEKYVEDPRYKARFLREARTVASLSHPAIAQVYSVETTTDGSLMIVMEYVEGRSLDDLLRSAGALRPLEAIRLVRQVADGLRAALRLGIIHRDIKPSNLLLHDDGRVKIVDFGLAKDLATDSSLTDDGIVLGTPQYISPEQGRGQPVDQRSDIYSLGTTFYHLITGRPPFEGKTQIAAIVAHVQEAPQAPHRLREKL
ncbi:MAG: serine/threonine protein kinase, partial [Planctomycetes bacterium]|nr:serine/threonine protein kinase [Planctomycetota bacterium]